MVITNDYYDTDEKYPAKTMNESESNHCASFAEMPHKIEPQ